MIDDGDPVPTGDSHSSEQSAGPREKLAEFTLEEPRVPRYGESLVASKTEAGLWRLALRVAAVTAFVFAGVIIYREMIHWTEAAKRAEEYGVLQAELERKEVGVRDGRSDVAPADLVEIRKAMDVRIKATEDDRQWRRSRFVSISVLLAIAVGISLVYLGLKQYHQYRAAVQDLIWGRMEAQRLADEAARNKAAKASADLAEQKKNDTAASLKTLSDAIEAQRVTIKADAEATNQALANIATGLSAVTSGQQGNTATLAALIEQLRRPTVRAMEVKGEPRIVFADESKTQEEG